MYLHVDKVVLVLQVREYWASAGNIVLQIRDDVVEARDAGVGSVQEIGVVGQVGEGNISEGRECSLRFRNSFEVSVNQIFLNLI